MFTQKSKKLKTYFAKDEKHYIKQIDKEEVIQNLPKNPIKAEPIRPFIGIGIIVVVGCLTLLILSFVFAYQLIIRQTADGFAIIMMILFFVSGGVGLFIELTSLYNDYINHRLYYSGDPQEEIYRLLLRHGRFVIGDIEVTRLYGDGRSVIHYSFSNNGRLTRSRYITNRNIALTPNDSILVFYYQDICSILLFE
jgi:hypothetical protein